MKPKTQKQLRKTAKKFLAEKRIFRRWLKTADGKAIYETILSEQKRAREKLARELAVRKRQQEREQQQLTESLRILKRTSYRLFNYCDW